MLIFRSSLVEMVHVGADNKKLCFTQLKFSLNLESLHTTKAVAIIQKSLLLVFFNVLAFRCGLPAPNEEIKKKLFTVDNFSKGLFSLFVVKAKTCLTVCLMKSKL